MTDTKKELIVNRIMERCGTDIAEWVEEQLGIFEVAEVWALLDAAIEEIKKVSMP